MAVVGYEYRVDGGTPVDVGNVTTTNVTGLNSSTEYSFEVRAYDGAGNYSAWSDAVAATTDAPPPITYVAGVATFAAGGNATTAGIDTTGATLIVIAQGANAANEQTPTDSNGNTWTALTQYTNSGLACRLYYCIDPIVGAGHTFTVIWGGGSNASIAVAAFANAGAFGVENGAGSASATTLQPGSVTPGANNAVVVTGLMSLDSTVPNSATIDSGFTIAAKTANTWAGVAAAIAYQIQTTAAAANPTWSTGEAAERTIAAIATFANA